MNLASICKLVQTIAPQAATSTVTGAAVDCAGFEEALVVLNVGTVPTAAAVDVHIETTAAEDWQDLEGAVFTQVTPSNDLAIYTGRILTENSKGRLRAVAVVTGDASPIAVTIILGQPHTLPAHSPSFKL